MTDDEVLRIEAQEFYKSLFGFVDQVDPDGLSLHSIPKLCSNGCSCLLATVTKKEVRNAIMGMGSFKAPSPDGFLLTSLRIIRMLWEIIFGIWLN